MTKYEEDNTIHFTLGNSKEARLLHQNINEYIRLTGLSRKQVYLRGLATYISAEDGNSKLVLQIANYLSGVGSRLGRPKVVKNGTN